MRDRVANNHTGNRLLIPYDRWIHVPPRAPIGRPDLMHGTSDHVLLLLGRVADFAWRDQKRKRQAAEANGGWRPPPGMVPRGPTQGVPGDQSKGPSGAPPGLMSTGMPAGMPAGISAAIAAAIAGGMPPEMAAGMAANMAAGLPMNGSQFRPQRGPNAVPNTSSGISSSGPSQNLFPAPGPQNGPPPVPAFFGMIPDLPTPTMPSAFFDAPRPQIYRERSLPPTTDHPTALVSALAKWTSISATLKTFENALSAPEWQPLPPSAAPPIATPFGTAIQYGSHHMAAIWLLFYTGRIILTRVHPDMPPAAMMAAGFAAPRTAGDANTVGRIVFGFQQPAADAPLDPAFDGLLTENMYSLFFGGVQYQADEQRRVTIERLLYISQKVGQDSAALTAGGLETAWIKAHEMGRGPPYKRTVAYKRGGDVLKAVVPGRSGSGKGGVLDEATLGRLRKLRAWHAQGVFGLDEDLAGLVVGEDD